MSQDRMCSPEQLEEVLEVNPRLVPEHRARKVFGDLLQAHVADSSWEGCTSIHATQRAIRGRFTVPGTRLGTRLGTQEHTRWSWGGTEQSW